MDPSCCSTTDMSCCSPLQIQDDSFLFQSLLDQSCDPLYSDPGYFSAGGSLSPTSSVDSFCFSPTSLQQNPLDCLVFGSPAAPPLTRDALPCSRSSRTTRRSRSRFPGKKRETASEREKLRMRDLTKALHHLRSFLPPSVAPAGQNLTKIETLRLTVRYISYLSAQLGLSEELLERRSSACGTPTLSRFLGRPTGGYGPPEPEPEPAWTSTLSPLQPSCQVSGGPGGPGGSGGPGGPGGPGGSGHPGGSGPAQFSSGQFWTLQQLQHVSF